VSQLSPLHRLALGAFVTAFAAGSAVAADIPVPAKIQLVKQDKKAGFVGKLAKIVAKPAATDFPLPGTAPTTSGATLRFFQAGAAGPWDNIALPAGQWTGIGGGSKGFKYKGAGSGADPCKLVLVKPTVIKALCKGPDSTDSPVPYTIPVGPGGAAWELVIGGDRYCAESSAATGAQIKKNDGTSGIFIAANASAPATCPEAGGPTPTPSPSPTPTPTPPPGGCTSAQVTIVTSYNPPPEDINGVTTVVTYPGPKLARDGNPTNLSGVSGIFNFGDNDTAVPGDGFNDTLSVGLLAIPGDIPPGNFASANFLCRVGAPVPVPADFGCTSDVSDANGLTVPSTCTVNLVVNP
jgi:hypothetical protein